MSCSNRSRGPVLIATIPPSPVLGAACFKRLLRIILSSFESSFALTGSSGFGSAKTPSTKLGEPTGFRSRVQGRQGERDLGVGPAPPLVGQKDEKLDLLRTSS